MADDNFHRDKASAWDSVAAALDNARPGWHDLANRGVDAAVAVIQQFQRELREETAIVDRIWDLLGRPTYAALKGRSIYELITELQGRAKQPMGDELSAYDAGLLNDYGGGDVGWWQDYIRAELARAHDFYQSQLSGAAQPAADTIAKPQGFLVSKTVTPATLRNVADWLMRGCDVGHAAAELRMMATDLERASSGETSDVGCHGLDNARQIFFYEQDYYVLSNFSAFRLNWQGWGFDTSEAAYHWEKFPDAPQVRESIRFATSAHEAFKVAERYRAMRRPDWDSVKVGVMKAILIQKALQHEYVRRKLLATGDCELIENSWRDDYWGWGPNCDGKNMLGKLWMEVRVELRASVKTGCSE